MFFKRKLKNYAKGSDERTIEVTGNAAIITLIVGLGIFLIEMLVKVKITKNLYSITWEASLLLLMIVIFVIIHLLNKIPMKK
ncbi:DUF2178 domain-containing protein [Clostridium sp. YIM B02505]|uniref:DUF2178 domain-containing protein n=1 Tax=Clostridium yunnanense TaxID=2800325 RepID=A0ABS1EUS1_9CLOT|nr:DUF2178 domain-containing protein [Clostridium yunnanense]MBK1813127.1 DUF2178 domain-containing protein [Clostridium yunnanense]